MKNVNPPERLVYTTEEAASSLSIGVTKTKELLRSGELRSFKIGRHRRIAVSALKEFVILCEMAENGVVE